MSSLECETSIDSLPEEVLCMIFDQLNVEDVKNASLTCQRWSNIIFLTPYVKRFRFKIELSNPWTLTKGRVMCFKTAMKNVVDYVNDTKRCYRHFVLTMEHIVPDDLQSIWECLHPKITESIYSLELNLNNISPDSVRLLAETIPLMPKLRSLIFFECGMRSLPGQITVLRSSSVQHLELRLTDNIRIISDMPELKTFVGPLSVLAQPDGTGAR
ncbi:uncharacterized protein LOC126575251 [Anopheles aquasalis]|uniref:uncharacterized protein LOC126575251 n=1 Tax=Anopheles aquasalis TaxID=42839 RepID=UPI00215AF6D8|nr:uncharacterized protein LOC126575251 [Anopheles aquasalis]